MIWGEVILFVLERKKSVHSSISSQLLALLENIVMSLRLYVGLTRTLVTVLFDISLKRSLKILGLMIQR